MSINNKVFLIGHVGQDPEIKNFDGKGKLARLSLATNENYTNAQGEKQSDTQWHQIVVWNGLAGVVEKYVKKGSHLAIDGRLIYRSYETDKGEKRYSTEVVVNEMQMLDSKKS